MKALVYHGPGRCGLEHKPWPTLEAATNVIISTDDLAPHNATTIEAVQALQNEGNPN